MRRDLANAVSLTATNDVGVAWWPSESPSMAHYPALSLGMSAMSRPWHQVAFPASPASSFDGVDVVIVGGGITGAGAARDAAMRGLRVAIVEMGDWGGATSSKSSKLVTWSF